MVPDHFRFGLCHGMLCHKDGAAVLVGKNGGLEGADLLGDGHDLFLVHADHGTEHGKGADLVGHVQGRQGLGSHLADALAGHQAQASAPLCQHLRDPHHVAAHDDGQLVMGTLLVDIELDLRKVDVVQIDGAGIAGHQRGQVLDLLQGALAGIGRRVVIDRVQPDAPLADHVAGHGGVDAAGKQQHGLSADAAGKASGPGDLVGIEEHLLPDLHVHHDLGVMDIHAETGQGFQDGVAQLRIDLQGIHGIGLVGTLGMDLEGMVSLGIFLFHEADHRFLQFLYGHDVPDLYGADAADAEDASELFHGVVIVIVGPAVNEDAAVDPVDRKLSVHGLQGQTDLAAEGLLEDVAVLSLGPDLGVLYKKCLVFHRFYLYLSWLSVWYICAGRGSAPPWPKPHPPYPPSWS